MSERLTLKIIPPGDGRGELAVEDAMRQILEAFELLSASGDGVVWRLVSASTNSPLTIVAEADDSLAAAEQSQVFAESMAQLQAGKFPDAWKRPELQGTAASLLRRFATSGMATQVQVRDEPTIVVAPSNVVRISGSFEGVEMLRIVPTFSGEPTKAQAGSIEGELIGVTTYRNKPAIRVRERKSGREIPCVVSEAHASRFSEAATARDVWTKRRVTVRGVLHYQISGELVRVDATEVDHAEAIRTPLPSLRDPSFTQGLSAAEYLERLRAGEIG